MSFGLTNALSIFTRLMKHVLREYLGKHVVLYFDDILIYSKSLPEHVEHVKSILITLRKKRKLYANFKKCSFCTEKINFLDFIIGKIGVEVDEEEVIAINDGPKPKKMQVKF